MKHYEPNSTDPYLTDYNESTARSISRKRDSNSGPGANLVVNRKSLNVEAAKRKDDKIRADNDRLLQKL